MVFSRRPQHRGTADIDVFNGIFETAIFIFGDRFKRVQIDDDEINGRDVLCPHDVLILLAAENTAMNTRVQGFNTAIHDLGETGMFTDTGYCKARLSQQFVGAACA